MDLATLKAFEPAEYEQAADGYRAAGDAASTAKDALDNRIAAGMRKDRLEGAAATAALAELKELSKNFHYAQTECGLASTALNGFAHDMAAAKRKLEAALEDAAAGGCTVNADGSVSYPAGRRPGEEKDAPGGSVSGSAWGGPTSDAIERQSANVHPNPHYGKAMGCANRIADALKEAADADAKWAPRLRSLKADDDLKVSDRDWTDVHADTGGVREAGKGYLDSLPDAPKSGDPKENAAWWKGLTPEEQSAHMSLNAAQVGALDGLPSATRDEANRIVFAEKRAELELRLAAIPPEPQKVLYGSTYPYRNPEWTVWNEKYGDELKSVTDNLKGVRAIQARFDATGKDGLPEAYLLGYDTKGGGRAVVANGDPDAADHTAVFVPGTYTDITETEKYVHHMTEMWKETSAKVPGQNVSTITWIGYDAPQSIVPEAMKEHYAHTAAPDLNRFMSGLEHVQGGDDKSHTTLIGHSYGSTVVGAASNGGDLRTDDIIAVGSPGMLVEYAKELDVEEGHVWSQAGGFTDDQVPLGGKLAGLGRNSDWWQDLLPFGSVWGQNVPSDESFGAHRMAHDSGSHTDYWRDGSLSIQNQASVVAGQYDKVQRD
ncbi:alpha/beta hydrolase [Streptomyces roseolus]|uniref:alpha/beta hydrolase n=2 Tax=Streptomyces roseolus TaxID=67358 RepID=UPI0037B3C347